VAWTTPATASAGSTALTAAFWNTNVRDNLSELAPFFAAWTSYTPTITAASGTPTTVSATGRYLKIGRLVLFSTQVTVTTVGTAAGNMQVALPFTADVSVCRDLGSSANSSGVAGSAFTSVDGINLLLQEYDGTTWWSGGAIVRASVSYLAQS